MSRGRKGNTPLLRELMVLICSISRENYMLTKETACKKLGISRKEMDNLIDILEHIQSPSHGFFPIVSQDGFRDDNRTEYMLELDPDFKGRPLKLTPEEVRAVLEALNACGMPADDPLRQKVIREFSCEGASSATADRHVIDTSASGRDYRLLCLIRDALLNDKALSFSYKGTKDKSSNARRAKASRITHENGAFYLEALDLDKSEQRKFKLDRMDDVSLIDMPENVDGIAPKDKGSKVTLIFDDPYYLDYFEWPALEISRKGEPPYKGRIPYFGPSSGWLPRQIAACAGTVHCSNGDVRKAAKAYAEKLLRDLS